MHYYGTRLSENISKRDPEGYLLCLNVPVARTGAQDYLPQELGLPPVPVVAVAEHDTQSAVTATPSAARSLERRSTASDTVFCRPMRSVVRVRSPCGQRFT